MAANAEAPDAYAFVLLKAVNGGTQVTFTDRDRKAGTTEFAGITNETAFFWTADQNLPAGTIVTIQTDVTGNPIADKGFTLGSPGGIGKSETIYAIAGGTIAGLGDGQAGQITAVGNHLATITLGGAAGTIPDAVTTAGTGISFTVLPANQTNAIYNGSLDRSDLAAFAARVKDPANWTQALRNSTASTGSRALVATRGPGDRTIGQRADDAGQPDGEGPEPEELRGLPPGREHAGHRAAGGLARPHAQPGDRGGPPELALGGRPRRR
jgi:hypothetical protein